MARFAARAALGAALLLGLAGVGTVLRAADAPAGAAAQAEPPEVGLWQTVSDKTGKPQGYVRVTRVGDELRGTIERGMPGDDQNELCTQCPGELKNQRKIGMTIITGLHKTDDDGWWAGGKVLDPDEGRYYRCKMRVIDAGRKLELRGYIGFSLLGRTQTWSRAE